VSIRLRLTLIYSTILALTLILFSAVLYNIQARYTLDILESDLSRAAAGLVQAWARVRFVPNHQAPPPQDDQGDAHPPPFMPGIRDLRIRDALRLLGPDGSVLALNLNEQDIDLELTISEEGLEQLRQGKTWTEILPGEESRWLVYNAPVIIGGELAGIVQTARPLADRDRSMQSLGLALLLGSLLTTVVAFGVGWGLSGLTLRPIHRITQTAQEIGETRDFSSRVSHKGPDDELGRLAKTLNGMLGQLQDAYQQVAHSLQMQREFVADVSHELRTPLTTIRGNLALLRREPTPPPTEREDILTDLTGESERLIRLVNDLLTLARADAGRKLKREPVALVPLLEDVCRQAQVLDPEREIVLDCAPKAKRTNEKESDATGPVVEGDPDALKQVLLTLIDNAIKHAQGTIRVVLDADEHSTTTHAALIRVLDSGPGMPPELRDRVFDRFYRGDASRSTPGFGLGLSIAKTLVEAQGGSIAVESERGQGSTFTVALPKVT
jgi:signal transduction histidine kinase